MFSFVRGEVVEFCASQNGTPRKNFCGKNCFAHLGSEIVCLGEDLR